MEFEVRALIAVMEGLTAARRRTVGSLVAKRSKAQGAGVTTSIT